MVATDENSVIRRKAGAGRPPPEIGRMTLARLMRTVLAQVAEDCVGMIAQATEVEEQRATLDSFAEAMPQNALIAMCEGPGGRLGAMVIDAQALAALIEMQTTGRVVPGAAAARTPTRTDAIMAADFIDRLLELTEQGAREADLPVADALTGYRYALALADKRALTMALEDIPYRLIDITLDAAQGAKTGQVQILLPHAPSGQGAAGRAPDEWQAALFNTVGCVPTELEVILTRQRLPLRQVMAFEPGDTVPIGVECIAKMRVEDVNGGMVARGRLGQVGGHRAVRLSLPCAEDDGADIGPGAPVTGDAPALLGEPTSAAPAFSDPASDGAMPDGLPDLGSLGDLPAGDGAMPDGPPDLGSLGDLPAGDGAMPDGLPDLGSLGDLPAGDGAMPDGLPDLGSLGDLPAGDGAMPDGLPDLGSLGDLGSGTDPGDGAALGDLPALGGDAP